ncbi:hypothetical protein B0I37DRAFT_395776 [Chaetomium sp. MPI-CAGE-AT-0009]|nr:hypothetical protein B0I37DRAFT_395776 [Chaetomium sp. MPI-CAGE-AT-0009]
MPNYEPTPRRFSTLYVPRTPSRKNSIDGAAYPGTIKKPGHPPVDLAEGLQHLQHVEFESQQDRGRPRQSGGDNARKAISGYERLASAPSARREGSASTRERIAVWEARSRSQSNSRSKSRGGDSGSKHRISVVPEVPDLALAFSAFRQEEVGRTVVEAVVPAKNAESQQQIVSPGHTHISHGANDGLWATDAPPRMVNTEHERPQTPVCQMREGPLTPEVTPKSSSSSPFGNVDANRREVGHQPLPARKSRVEGEASWASITPATPMRNPKSINTALPLTPQATPERERNGFRGGDQDGSYPLEADSSDPSSAVGYTAVLQPKASQSPIPMEDGPVTQSHAHYHLPSGLLSDESPQQTQQGHTVVSEGPGTRQSDQPPNQRETIPGPETEPLYHNVWRINSYQPDFPLPHRPSNYVDVQTLRQAGFVGNPLQELPRGQLPAEPRNSERSGLDPYPYPRAREPGGGDWAVDIPPSPSTAYFSGDQRVRSPRSRSRGRVQYHIARNEVRRHEWDAPSVIERALHAASVSMIQGLNVPVGVYRGLRDMYYPAPSRPDIVKAYPVRRRLPIRIFFPSHHDLTSPALLPTLLTIHGGAFTVGTPADDDPWNRTFADSYTVLVIALNYAKAPWAAFPAPLLDTEALYHAILNDESLPIDRMRVALAGFDAGANLALALSQLPSLHTLRARRGRRTSVAGVRGARGPAAACLCGGGRAGLFGYGELGRGVSYLWGDEVARMDAEMKTVAYQREMAEWLWGVVWR